MIFIALYNKIAKYNISVFLFSLKSDMIIWTPEQRTSLLVGIISSTLLVIYYCFTSQIVYDTVILQGNKHFNSNSVYKLLTNVNRPPFAAFLSLADKFFLGVHYIGLFYST